MDDEKGIEEGCDLLTTMDFDDFMDHENQDACKHLLEHVAATPIVVGNENIRVNVGIDKDLEMILEMDPSIIDLVGVDNTKLKSVTNVTGLPPIKGGPSFKTVTPTSRTHLKLQLQREQQQQELEAERRSSLDSQSFVELQQQKRKLKEHNKEPSPVTPMEQDIFEKNIKLSVLSKPQFLNAHQYENTKKL